MEPVSSAQDRNQSPRSSSSDLPPKGFLSSPDRFLPPGALSPLSIESVTEFDNIRASPDPGDARGPLLASMDPAGPLHSSMTELPGAATRSDMSDTHVVKRGVQKRVTVGALKPEQVVRETRSFDDSLRDARDVHPLGSRKSVTHGRQPQWAESFAPEMQRVRSMSVGRRSHGALSSTGLTGLSLAGSVAGDLDSDSSNEWENVDPVPGRTIEALEDFDD